MRYALTIVAGLILANVGYAQRNPPVANVRSCPPVANVRCSTPPIAAVQTPVFLPESSAAPIVVASTPTVVVSTPGIVAGNLHSHQCGKCGTMWTHSDASFGSVADHTCPNPNCRSGPYWNKVSTAVYSTPVYSRPVTYTPTVRYAPTVQYGVSNCPTGNCPLR